MRWTRSGVPSEALAVGILADLAQDLADGGLDAPVRPPDRLRAPPSIAAAESSASGSGRGSSPISVSISSTIERTWSGSGWPVIAAS